MYYSHIYNDNITKLLVKCYILRWYRVANSPDCKMGTNNLARVFGPTLIGHGSANPDPVDMLQDTKSQPKVVVMK